MIRPATRDDIPRIMAIRFGVRENRLRDPSRVTVDHVRAHVDTGGAFVWVDAQRVVGFSIAEPRDGNIVALFVEEPYERRGIGRALFERACDVLLAAGCPRLWLTTWPGTRADGFYRAAGWQVTGEDDGNLVFERPRT